MMGKVALTVDGLEVVVEKGTSVLEAALRNNIYIPHLCYHPDLKPAGVCRLCLIELGDGRLVTSCLTPVEQGMVVRTGGSKIDKMRRAIVELLIANHHTDCRHCPKSGNCELQRIMAYLHVSVKRMRPLRLAKKELSRDTSNPFFDYDPNRCILCGICVRTCENIQGVSAFQFMGRGYGAKIAFFGDGSKCESCGECVARCPVGALVPKAEG